MHSATGPVSDVIVLEMQDVICSMQPSDDVAGLERLLQAFEDVSHAKEHVESIEQVALSLICFDLSTITLTKICLHICLVITAL